MLNLVLLESFSLSPLNGTNIINDGVFDHRKSIFKILNVYTRRTRALLMVLLTPFSRAQGENFNQIQLKQRKFIIFTVVSGGLWWLPMVD